MRQHSGEADAFEAERPRLLRVAARVLGDPTEAQDVVQQAWIRLHGTTQDIDDLPAWLTTVTTRLCLDRLKAKVPEPQDGISTGEHAPDPAEDVALAGTVAVALRVVLERLTPTERVSFVLHDTFGFEFSTIAAILDTTPAAARKLASRARAKVAQPSAEDALADWVVVDAFLAAAREGEFEKLLELLAPEAVVSGDPVAVAMGTPERIIGRRAVAEFFNGAAATAFSAFVADRPGAAWIHRGETKVAFDFAVSDGVVQSIHFRADPAVLAEVRRRRDGAELPTPSRRQRAGN